MRVGMILAYILGMSLTRTSYTVSTPATNLGLNDQACQAVAGVILLEVDMNLDIRCDALCDIETLLRRYILINNPSSTPTLDDLNVAGNVHSIVFKYAKGLERMELKDIINDWYDKFATPIFLDSQVKERI